MIGEGLRNNLSDVLLCDSSQDTFCVVVNFFIPFYVMQAPFYGKGERLQHIAGD